VPLVGHLLRSTRRYAQLRSRVMFGDARARTIVHPPRGSCGVGVRVLCSTACPTVLVSAVLGKPPLACVRRTVEGTVLGGRGGAASAITGSHSPLPPPGEENGGCMTIRE